MRRFIILAIMERHAIFARVFLGLPFEARCASIADAARQRVLLPLFSASFQFDSKVISEISLLPVMHLQSLRLPTVLD